MNENVISYDYKTIKAKREMESIITDTYENLGWEVTNTSSVEGSIFQINISLKRNRKVTNKIELLKLQDKADNAIATIQNLQNKKKNAGLGESVAIGIIGALTFGGGMSMSMLLSGIGFTLGGIALGLIGAGIAIIAYPICKKINKKKSIQIQPLIESEMDKLSDASDNAAALR